MEFTASSLEEMNDIGKKIAESLSGGDIVLLVGDLGAGKTTLSKSIASSFGIDPDTVVSPTFTIMQVYEGSTTLVHVDTYRLEEAEDLVDIGLQEHLGESNTICLIEWPEKVMSLIPEGASIKKISITTEPDNSRRITVN